MDKQQPMLVPQDLSRLNEHDEQDQRVARKIVLQHTRKPANIIVKQVPKPLTIPQDKSPTRNRIQDFQTSKPYQQYMKQYINFVMPTRNSSQLPDVFKSEVSYKKQAEQSILTRLTGSPQEKLPALPKINQSYEVMRGLRSRPGASRQESGQAREHHKPASVDSQSRLNNLNQVSGQQLEISQPFERYRSAVRERASLASRISHRNDQIEVRKSLVVHSRSLAPSVHESYEARHRSVASLPSRIQDRHSIGSSLPSITGSSQSQDQKQDSSLQRHPWLTSAKRSVQIIESQQKQIQKYIQQQQRANKNFSQLNGQALMGKLRRLKDNQLRFSLQKRRNSQQGENDLAIDYQQQREQLENFRDEKHRLNMVENLHVYKTIPQLNHVETSDRSFGSTDMEDQLQKLEPLAQQKFETEPTCTPLEKARQKEQLAEPKPQVSEVFSIKPKSTKKVKRFDRGRISPGEQCTLESKESNDENLKRVSLPQIDLVLGVQKKQLQSVQYELTSNLSSEGTGEHTRMQRQLQSNNSPVSIKVGDKNPVHRKRFEPITRHSISFDVPLNQQRQQFFKYKTRLHKGLRSSAQIQKNDEPKIKTDIGLPSLIFKQDTKLQSKPNDLKTRYKSDSVPDLNVSDEEISYDKAQVEASALQKELGVSKEYRELETRWQKELNALKREISYTLQVPGVTTVLPMDPGEATLNNPTDLKRQIQNDLSAQVNDANSFSGESDQTLSIRSPQQVQLQKKGIDESPIKLQENYYESKQFTAEPETEQSKETRDQQNKQSPDKPVILKSVPKQTIIERQQRSHSQVELETCGTRVQSGFKARNALIDLANEFAKKHQQKMRAQSNSVNYSQNLKRVNNNILQPKLNKQTMIKKVLQSTDRKAALENKQVSVESSKRLKLQAQQPHQQKPQVMIQSLKIPENNNLGQKIPVTREARRKALPQQNPRIKSPERRSPSKQQLNDFRGKSPQGRQYKMNEDLDLS